MAIGERIHYFRLLRNLTQKKLGTLIGFSESQADIRILQYEKSLRSPKNKNIELLAQIFNISSHALTVPNIDTEIGLIHTLFALEDIYDFTIKESNGELFLHFDKSISNLTPNFWNALSDWNTYQRKLDSGEITREQYNQWRYNLSVPDKNK